MPQMAPLNWIIMFLMFIMLLMLTINKIYFLMEKNKNNSISKDIKFNTQYKWMW